MNRQAAYQLPAMAIPMIFMPLLKGTTEILSRVLMVVGGTVFGLLGAYLTQRYHDKRITAGDYGPYDK